MKKKQKHTKFELNRRPPKYDPNLTNKDRMQIRAKIRKINAESGQKVFDTNTLERVR